MPRKKKADERGPVALSKAEEEHHARLFPQLRRETVGEQDNAAAERSAPTPERGPDLKAEARGVPVDHRKHYWVQLVNRDGQVVREWQTRFAPEEERPDYALRIVPV